MHQAAFDNPKLWERYLAQLKTWEGTPYRHLQYVKGHGADCALFIGAALNEVGIMQGMAPPEYYPKDWYRTGYGGDLIRDNLLEHFCKYTPHPYYWGHIVPTKEEKMLVRGDILAFSMNSTGITNHVAVYVGNQTLCHSVVRKEVLFSTLVTFWWRHLVGVFRLFVEN